MGSVSRLPISVFKNSYVLPLEETRRAIKSQERACEITCLWDIIFFWSDYICMIHQSDLIERSAMIMHRRNAFAAILTGTSETLKYWFVPWSWFNWRSVIESSSVRGCKQRPTLKCTFYSLLEKGAFYFSF